MMKNKKLYREIIAIAVPVTLQTLIGNSLGMIDQMMIGQLGETCIAAVALACKPFFILSFALGGLCAVSSIFSSQAEGAGDSSRHSAVMKAALLGSMAVTLPFFLLSFFTPHFLLGLFTSDEAVISRGCSYLRIVSVSYIPEMLVIAGASILRSTGFPKVPMASGMIVVATNTVLNAILIFGLFGFPSMNETGAAWATLVSRFIEFAIIAIFLRIKKHPAEFITSLKAKVDRDFLRKFYLTSLPAIGNEMLWAIGGSVYAMIYGHIGTNALSAITLTEPVQCISVGFFCGLSTSASILLGYRLGAKDFDAAYKDSWKFLKYSALLCAVMALIVFFISGIYVRLYNVSDEVRNLSQQLLWVFAVYIIIKVCNMVTGSGILRSGGETKTVLFLDVLGTYGIGIPLGILGAFVFKMNVVYVYALLSLEEAVRLVLGLWFIKRKKWMKVL